MVLISLWKRRTGSLGGFTQFHIRAVMTHLMFFFFLNVLFFVFQVSALISPLSPSIPSPLYVSLPLILSLIFRSFLYFHNGRLRQVPPMSARGEKGDDSYLYSYLGRIQRGKNIRRLCRRQLCPVYSFCPAGCFSGGYCGGLARVLRSDWTERPGPRTWGSSEMKSQSSPSLGCLVRCQSTGDFLSVGTCCSWERHFCRGFTEHAEKNKEIFLSLQQIWNKH